MINFQFAGARVLKRAPERSRLAALVARFRTFLQIFGALLLLRAPARADSWLVRIEEPTGIYARTNELVAVPYSRIGRPEPAWQILDSQGNEQPWQATDKALLFPVTLIPGQLPEYRISPAPGAKTNFVNQILLRKLGLNRVEFGNRF